MASNPIMPLSSGTDKQFRCFPLDLQRVDVALLPPEHELIINVQSGYFFVINWDVRYPVLDGKFSEAELLLALALLGAWPSFMRNEKLLQVVTNRSAQEVAELLELTPDEALEPLHCLVDMCRLHFHAFGIEIQDVGGEGYKLSHYMVQGGGQA